MITSRPRSAASFSWALLCYAAGLIVFLVMTFMEASPLLVAVSVFGVTALSLMGYEARKIRHGIRPEGITSPQEGNWARTGVKLAGLLVTLLGVALFHWVMSPWIARYIDHFIALSPALLFFVLLVSPLFFFETDRRMKNPHDSYWDLGRLVIFQERPRDWGALRTHALGWLIKAIFLPLMLTWLINWTANFGAIVRSDLTDPANLFKCAFAFVIFFDLVGASLGYVSTFKIFGTQIKSVQCLFVGWIAALICYPPLNHLISVLVEKTDKTAWMQPLEAQPVLLVTVALVIIALELVYVLATVAFGLHFSNLTHRGIITGGPYRWTKHPAYLAKNCFWWMMALPVMVTSEVPIWIATCVAAISLIYFVRAKSEEIHLRNDTVYRDYAEWIEENGLFAPLNRLRRKIFAVSSIRPVTSRLAGR